MPFFNQDDPRIENLPFRFWGQKNNIKTEAKLALCSLKGCEPFNHEREWSTSASTSAGQSSVNTVECTL